MKFRHVVGGILLTIVSFSSFGGVHDSTTFLLRSSSDIKMAPLPSEDDSPILKAMSLYGDSKTMMGFSWSSVNPVDSNLEVIEASIGDFSSSEVKKFIGSVEKSPADNSLFLHRATATGLKAGTKYLYRYGDTELENYCETGSFVTSKGNESKLNFVHLSDPQGWEKEHYEGYASLLNIVKNEISPSFLLNTGDIVNNDWAGHQPSLEQWKWALDDCFDELKDMPVAAVAGNHEAADYDFSSRFNFARPASDNGQSGTYYSFDYGPAHFTAINTNDTTKTSPGSGLGEEQLTWIKSDLESSKSSKWKFVFLHKGLFDAGAHCSNLAEDNDYDIPFIREQLAPLFTEYGIDIVFQGHDHLYSRSKPTVGLINNGATSYTVDTSYILKEEETDAVLVSMYSNLEGQIYLNSGSASGSKYYETVQYDGEIIHIEKAENIASKMFTGIEINGDKLIATTYAVRNNQKEIYSSFGIDKTLSDDPVVPGPVPETNPNSSLPLYVYFLIGGGALLLVAGGVVLFIYLRKKVTKHG